MRRFHLPEFLSEPVSELLLAALLAAGVTLILSLMTRSREKVRVRA